MDDDHDESLQHVFDHLGVPAWMTQFPQQLLPEDPPEMSSGKLDGLQLDGTQSPGSVHLAEGPVGKVSSF